MMLPGSKFDFRLVSIVNVICKGCQKTIKNNKYTKYCENCTKKILFRFVEYRRFHQKLIKSGTHPKMADRIIQIYFKL